MDKQVDKQISELTSQLDKLEIEYNNNRSKLLKQRRQLLLRTKKSSKGNTFKIGQRVRIINNYSGDYGNNNRGLIGTVIKVNKVQVNLKADNGLYYNRSYKNLELIEKT